MGCLSCVLRYNFSTKHVAYDRRINRTSSRSFHCSDHMSGHGWVMHWRRLMRITPGWNLFETVILLPQIVFDAWRAEPRTHTELRW